MEVSEHEYRCRLCDCTEARVEAEGIRDWEYGAEGEFSYLRCERCAVVQLHPFPGIDDLKRAYPETYIGHVESSGSRGPLYKLLYDAKEALFNRKIRPLLPPGARVLDVGCGNGEFLIRLQQLGAAELQGIDFSPRAVELAARRGIPVFEGVFSDFEAEPESFEMIVMYNYLEHTLHPDQELAKARKLLVPGGHLIGELPNFGAWDRRLAKRYWGGNHVPRHTFQFDPRTLEAALSDADFSEVRLAQELNPTMIALSVQNFLQRHQRDLAHNTSVPHGRAPYNAALMLLCLPLNTLLVLARRAGVLKFFARA